MNKRLDRILKKCLAILAVLLIGLSGVHAQSAKADLPQLQKTISQLDANYRAGSIQTLAMADMVLSATSAAQADLQTWFAQAEQDCYEKFFVTACLNHVKLLRRDNATILQRIKVEAKAFQRLQRINELDERLKEKNLSLEPK